MNYGSYRCYAPERHTPLNSVCVGRRHPPGSISIVPFDVYAVPFSGNPPRSLQHRHNSSTIVVADGS